ncbi:MAG: aldehyde dehydrogenase family protein [Pseudomonas sp.]|jgi:acyl-CoA reductase-like NAD-dependent aldehyde dehydrogenase|uniref:aldehyde dehydrogenase family protein n=1 Tax=Pseudomonas sp. TaxID=306 RepID=UPI001202C620|nr:aldehyde dehydrogenase family protein [Pseudomonas sp.]RZI71203.1 MAG: aldehyde dehydrogenase family protein [Pseudomonas sp.]
MTQFEALNLIGGEWQPAQSGAWGTRRDPADGASLGRHAASACADADAAIAAARRAFDQPGWAQNPRLRQMVMLRWADRLEARAEELARLLTRENGKVIAQSRGEISGAISEIRYYAGLTRYLPGHVLEVEPGAFSTLLKEPAGVAGIIVPWNAPAVLLIRSLTPALAAGCTTVIKPAPQTALITAALVAELHAIEGLPAGVVNLVSEDGHEVAARLVESTDIDVISFTGSNATGQRIMAAAAPTMKKLSLELGGKSSCLVFEDADVQAVAPALASAATIISGQQCTAARRVLVHAKHYDAMKVALTAALRSLKVASGMSEGAQIGPMIDDDAARNVGQRIEEAMDAADEVLLRGGRGVGVLSGGAFLTPTLVAHRDTSAFFVQEEIFGPLLVLERFEDEVEAVARANHSEFGLSASVWTRDGARALRVARALRNGTVWINDHNKLFAEAETGGYRRSGLGRLHGYDALIDFQEIKHIYQQVGTL